MVCICNLRREKLRQTGEMPVCSQPALVTQVPISTNPTPETGKSNRAPNTRWKTILD